MRTVIRKEVDINQQLNLRRLSPLNKIIVAIRKEWQSTSMFRNSDLKRKREAYQRKIKREEEIKGSIIANIYAELINGKSTKNAMDLPEEIIISVDSSFGDVLFDKIDKDTVVYKGILNHSDFAQFNLSVIKENADLRRAFPNMPYLIKVSRKVIV